MLLARIVLSFAQYPKYHGKFVAQSTRQIATFKSLVNSIKLKQIIKENISCNIQSGLLYLVGQFVDEHSQVPKSTGDSPNIKQIYFSKLKGKKLKINPNSKSNGKGWLV